MKVVPPSVLTSHCTVAPVPLAAAVKVAVSPASTVWLAGFVVRSGRSPPSTWRGCSSTVPTLLVKTASYW